MHSLRAHTRLVLAAAVILLAALAPASAAASYIPGVTDSSTGVQAELERRHAVEDRYIPGVTDSSTGVLRELERDGAEPNPTASPTSADDPGVLDSDDLIAATAAFAALAAGVGLGIAAERRRRVVTT